MGKYQLDYKALNELADEFVKMDDDLKMRIKDTTTEIGKNLRNNTIAAIPKGKTAKHGVHLADDVKMSVRVTDRKASITVNGGKNTGGYWFMVDNGHVAQNGRFVQGAHFTDKAYNATEVSEPVDKLIQEILNE